MPDPQFTFSPRAAFAGLPRIATEGAGVVVSERDGMGLATVLVRRGQLGALARRVQEQFGIELPRGPRRISAGGIAFAATSPGGWLAMNESGGNAFAESLLQVIGDGAAISDQSDGYAVLRLSGHRVRDALCKLVPIDLHPRAFKVGDVAATVAAHIGVALWRLEDEPEGTAVFEIAVFRSLAGSFWNALSESAAEFGFKVSGP